MSWFSPFSENVKKRLCRYLLNRYLGDFIQEKLALNQLSVNLYKGTGEIRNVTLNVNNINESLDSYNIPIEFVDGYVGLISISVPWSAILKDSCVIEIKNLDIIVQPKQRKEDMNVHLDEMINSMTTSMQLAEDYMKQEPATSEQNAENAESFVGVDSLSQMMESVFTKVKVIFSDIFIRIEHLPKASKQGTAVEIHIKRFEFFDEQLESSVDEDPTNFRTMLTKISKKCILMGVSAYCEEFLDCNRTMSRSSYDESPIIQQPKLDSDNNLNKSSKPIQILECLGKQEIIFRLKQNQEISGPKIQIDYHVGSMHAYLSPKQVHLVLELINGLLAPGTCDNSNVFENRPMTTSEFEECAKNLERQVIDAKMRNHIAGAAGNGGVWRDADFSSMEFAEQPDSESIYFELDSNNMSSSMSSDRTTSTAATGYYNYSSNVPKRDRNKLRDEHFSSEITLSKIKLNLLTMVILHEDPPSEKGDQLDPEITSWQKLGTLAEKYFGRVRTLNWSCSNSNLKELRLEFARICIMDHLSLVMKPVTIDFSQTTDTTYNLAIDVTVGNGELVECLYERTDMLPTVRGVAMHVNPDTPDVLELINFKEASTKKACFKMKIQHAEKTEKVKNFSIPKTQIKIDMAPFTSEIDISLIDRIRYLLNMQTLSDKRSNFEEDIENNCTAVVEEVFAETSSDLQIDFELSCPSVELVLKFPIADLRPSQCPEKLPWWRKSLREDHFNIYLTDLSILSSMTSGTTESKIEIITREALVSFKDVNFLRIYGDEGFNYSKIILKFYSKQSNSLVESEEESEDSTPNSYKEEFCKFSQRDPSPFSTKRSLFENEEMIIPGNKKELSAFEYVAKSNTQMSIELDLSQVAIFFPSKDLFEEIYNRFINDLLMWQTTPIEIIDKQAFEDDKRDFSTTHQYQYNSIYPLSSRDNFFSMDNASSSDSEESLPTLDEHKSRTRKSCKQNNLCVTININKGNLIGFCDIENDTQHFGQFQISMEDATFFLTSAFGGDANLDFMFFSAHRANLSHNVLENNELEKSRVSIYTEASPELLNTIFLSETNILECSNLKINQCDGDLVDNQVVVAVKICLDPTRNVKDVLTSVGIKGSTLRHRVVTSENWWITQLMDFLSLKDIDIYGYVPPNVVSETHIHVWNCGIDYRPLSLPLRAFITLESFSFSSNIIAESYGTSMRFIIQDGALLLSDRCKEVSVNLQNNYTCVLDIGMLELIIRMHKNTTSKYPPFDLRISNNLIRLRTCADSFRALTDIIQYFAMEYDLDPDDTFSEMTQSNNTVVSKKSTPDISEEDMVELRDLMADAIKEEDSDNEKEIEARRLSCPLESETSIFSMEHDLTGNLETSHSGDDLARELMNASLDVGLMNEEMKAAEKKTSRQSVDHTETSDGFCTLKTREAKARDARDVINNVKVLSESPIEFVEDHFDTPDGQRDALDAPDDFPNPLSRFTIRDISIVWYLYGGRDFASEYIPASKWKTPQSYVCKKKYRNNQNSMNWQAAGGCRRKHDILMEFHLNKVRFRSESYPENKVQAARYILLVDEFEIRDRLEYSNFNKFLYLHTTQDRPKPSNGNMIAIKALFDRPDPNDPTQECSLKISLLPLRLNIDQDALFFLLSFFREVANNPTESKIEPYPKGTPPDKTPIMTVGGTPPGGPNESDLMIMFDEIEGTMQDDKASVLSDECSSKPIFFRSFLFSGPVIVKIDYQGKRIDMEQGPLAGVLVGLANLNNSEIRLKSLHYKAGLKGIEKIVEYACREWLQDIKKSQLPALIGGVGPLNAFIHIFKGVRDLFCLPVEQFQKDGRIIEGIRRGTYSFTTGTAMAALELTNRLIGVVQSAAEMTYDLVTPGPSVRYSKKRKRRRRTQPADVREGVANAYHVLTDGIKGTAKNIYGSAKREHEQKGVTGAVGAVLRELPPTAIQPFIFIPEATSNVLGGMRNQLLPDKKREEEEKWKEDKED
ncbi:DgyrCDS3044 [Dimorphilus gyrociliatus]|uniref:Autophagy-related protein 2 n=2 Tax=Dimorphilus gyrociliatus TaxID=2664684 RepID=A0A7I8VDX2_9ANNE|nr:DgyrCDS3044 [Dimorphilus gyrociliatus]